MNEFQNRLGIEIERISGQLSGRSLVVYSSIIPLFRASGLSGSELVTRVGMLLLELVGSQGTLVMPTFTPGFVEGVCDLDRVPSQTGQLTEWFRRQPGVRRSRSAFFSFAAIGSEAASLVEAETDEPWGDRSPLAWMEEQNAHLLMLGVHPTLSSYPHRGEWLFRKKLSYREPKQFTGILRIDGKEKPWNETLWVRKRDRVVENDFTKLLPRLEKRGVETSNNLGFPLAQVQTLRFKAVLLECLRADPDFLLKKAT